MSKNKKVITQPTSGSKHQQNDKLSKDIVKTITDTIDGLKPGFQAYKIRELVEHAEKFGPYLRKQRLETNQIRKFLDAINRVKAELIGDEIAAGQQKTQNQTTFADIEDDIVLLKPKLAYAAARQDAAKPLSDVMSAAIDKVHSIEDFTRLVQFIESIIAYHKAAGGK